MPVLIISPEALRWYALLPTQIAAIHIKLDDRTTTTGVVMTDQVKALDLTARNAKFVEKIPNDILSEICDIISGFTEIEETEN